MTVDIKNNGIPVGLGAWIPKEPEIKATTWKDYIPKWESATDSLESATDSWDSFQKRLASALYGLNMSETEAEAFFQLAEKEQAEKEALEHAKMYFGEYN